MGRGGTLLEEGLGVLSGDVVAAECAWPGGGGRLAGRGGGERSLTGWVGSDMLLSTDDV